MQNLDEQQLFIKYVQGRSTLAEMNQLHCLLDERSSKRLSAYQKSYRGRVLGVLSDTVLLQARIVFGEEIICNLLYRYFGDHPSASSMISDSLNSFPAWILDQGGNDSLTQLLASLTSVCLDYWNLAKGPDPSQETEEMRLKPSRFIPARSEINLFQAWLHPENSSPNPELYCGRKSVGVLLVKTSTFFLSCFPVVSEFEAVARGLTKNAHLEEVLEGLSDSQIQLLDPKQWSQWISRLTTEKCWKGLRT
jgi:hypothetical protein